MRFAVLVLAVFAAAAVAVVPQSVTVVPVPVTTLRAAAPPLAFPVCTPVPRIDPAALWQPLVRMSPQERANGELLIGARSPEAREATALWNRGEYDAAIVVLQRWAEQVDLRHIYVGFNWRVPVQAFGADWGTNVRVGTRDSAIRIAFDRNNSTGNLMVASACLDSGNTSLIVDLSTDGGSTWAETHYGYWNGAAEVRDLEMAGSAGFEYVAHILATIPDSAFCYRFNAATGALALMPDSTLRKTVLKTSVSGDTLDEVAITSSDDQLPGWEIEVVGGTRQHLVEAGYTSDQGVTWGSNAALPYPFFWGGLDYCYNQFDTTGPRSRYVAFSCLFYDGSTYHLGYAYYDTSWHGYYIAAPTLPQGNASTTGIAAWQDTFVLAYQHVTATGVAVRCLFSYDALSTVGYWFDMTDSADTRENVAVTARHGDGVGVAWRDHGGGARWIVHRRGDYAGTSWTGPDTVSDHRPDGDDRPRIQRVAPGVYGVCYISQDTPDYGSLWFNRDDWGGIAGPTPERVVPMGLAAVTRRGGARLSFVNPVAGPVTLKVYDAAGRRVRCRTEQLKPGGQTLDCAVPASGSYIAVLKTPAVTATTKFSTVR